MNAFSKFKAQNNEIHILWNIAYPRCFSTAQNKTAYFAKRNSGLASCRGGTAASKRATIKSNSSGNNGLFKNLQYPCLSLIRHCRLTFAVVFITFIIIAFIPVRTYRIQRSVIIFCTAGDDGIYRTIRTGGCIL